MKWLDPILASGLEAEGTNAYRIASGRDAWIELFGSTVVISAKDRAQGEALVGELDAWITQTGLAIERIYLRQLVRQPRETDQLHLFRGDPERPTSEIVQEDGLRYEVDFAIGYSTGLFCDQRTNRRFLRSLSPQRVLNTFSYTCAFSVAAASCGAETVNIDLSKSSLSRGRRNFELNGLDSKGHRFLVGDVLATLPRLARNETKPFDLIILDPPTFGRSGSRKAFRAAHDFEDLIALALTCATPEAHLLLSTNCSTLRAEKLRSMAARVARGKMTFHQEPPQPDFPPGHGSETLWMQRGKRSRR